MKKRMITKITAVITALMLVGCSGISLETDSSASQTTEGKAISVDYAASANTSTASTSTTIASTTNSATGTDFSDIFSKRDLNQEPDTSDAEIIEVSDGKTYTITAEGIYLIKGTAENATIRVEADKEAKVQLVLDGVSITNEDFPAIYVVSADKCFVTTTDSENTLKVTGKYTTDGDTKTDAVIYSKDDLVLNGVGTLNIVSNYGNGISGKDDVKVTGGTYNIISKSDGIEANDSIAVYDGNFNIQTNKDGLHSENDDDDSVGWIYIKDGNFNINVASDGIQATTFLVVDGGNIEITASEGFEATYIQINGGNVNIMASDDGMNASYKSKSYTVPVIEFNGGTTTIEVGQGDTDAIDSNGNIYVNGGTINVTSTISSFDYDGTAEYNGGTIIINGTQVDSIPESMMMGGPGGMGGFGGKDGFGGPGGMGNFGGRSRS